MWLTLVLSTRRLPAVILVDDHIARMALSGRRLPGWGSQTPVLPWTLHLLADTPVNLYVYARHGLE